MKTTQSQKRRNETLSNYFILAKKFDAILSEKELEKTSGEIMESIERMMNRVGNWLAVEGTPAQVEQITPLIHRSKKSMYDFDKYGLIVIKLIGINNM